MNGWEELLASIKDEPDRQAIETVASKHPELKNGWLRQSDYSRKMDAIKKTEDYVKGWEKWKDDNWVPEAYALEDGTKVGATKRELEKDAVIADLQKRIEVGGSEVTFEDLSKEIAKHGFVSKDSFDKTIGEKESGLKQYVDNFGGIALDAVNATVRHLKEFDEVLDPKKVIEYGAEHKKATFGEAYDSFVAERREAKRKEQFEAELAKARQEGAEAKEKEFQAKGHVMPADTGEPTYGPMAQFLQAKAKTPGDTSSVPFGRGDIARVAAEGGGGS